MLDYLFCLSAVTSLILYYTELRTNYIKIIGGIQPRYVRSYSVCVSCASCLFRCDLMKVVKSFIHNVQLT